MFDPLGFQQFLIRLIVSHPLFQFLLDVRDGFLESVFPRQVMFGRVNIHLLRLAEYLACQRVNLRNMLHLVPKEGHAVTAFVFVGGNDFQGIPAHPEGSRLQLHVIALILAVHQLPDQGIPPGYFSHFKANDAFTIFFRVAQPVDARD